MIKRIGCRLCGGTATLSFHRTVLQKYAVGYFKCHQCSSLQTEEPYWLQESYADARRVLDTRGVERAQQLVRTVYFLQRIFMLRNDARVLDWGGGDGLFVRMLRDIGIDAFRYDPMCENVYAAGFDGDLSSSYEIVSAFEVWEHLAYPATEIEQIFSTEPRVHIATTGIFKNQTAEWPYLNTLTGRHVFFFSRKAIDSVAAKYGYQYLIHDNKLLVFYKDKLNWARRYLLYLLTTYYNTRLGGVLFAAVRKPSLSSLDQRQVEQLVRNGQLWPKLES